MRCPGGTVDILDGKGGRRGAGAAGHGVPSSRRGCSGSLPAPRLHPGKTGKGGGTQLNVFLLQLSFKENLPFHSCLSKMSANAKCPEPHMLYTREAP